MNCIKLLFLLLHLTDAYVIMSVDVGSRFVKNAIIRSGYQAETVYDDFGRKFSSAVSVSAQQAKIGDDAIRELAKHPHDTFLLFTDLLSSSDDFLPIWTRMFPGRKYLPDSKIFVDSRNQQHRLEELLALLLLHSAKRANAFAEGSKIDACILALPNFYNYLNRHLMMTVAETAGVNITTLVPVNLAAAFGFALLHTNEYERNPMHILLIDIGGANSQMSVFQLSHRKHDDEDAPVPSLITLSTKYDRTLGVWRFQSAIMESIIEQVEKKTKFERSPKIMGRLFLEAERILKRLAVEKEIDVTIENVSDGLDLDFHISQEEIEKKTVGLVQVAQRLAEDAIRDANLTAAQISQVIVAGGGSRIAWLESGICKFLNRSSGKFDWRINVDEGTALGAVYYGASHSQFFRTPKFMIKDKLSYSVKVIVPPVNKSAADSEISLFNEGILYPRRKSLYFRNRDKDFSIKMQIAENNVTIATKTVSIKGIQKVIKDQPPGSSYHGVKMTVEVDMSQVLRVEKVEYRVSTPETSGGLKGLKDKLLHSLGLGHDDASKSFESTDNVSKPDVSTNATETLDNVSRSNETEKVNATVAKPKAVSRSIPLHFETLDSLPETGSLLELIRKRLEEYENTERLEREKEMLQNDVEAWLYEWSDKITRDDVAVFVKDSEREAIKNATAVNREWFDESGTTATRQELADRLNELKKLVRPIEERIEERRKREASLLFLQTLFNVTRHFLDDRANFTQENDTTPRTKPLVTHEVDRLEKLYNRTKEWVHNVTSGEKNRSLSEDPAVLSSEIDAKMMSLTKELERLSNKVRHFRPPPPPPAKPKVTVNVTKLNETEELLLPELLGGDNKTEHLNASTNATSETNIVRDEL